jgi:acyl-CoA thioesterase II
MTSTTQLLRGLLDLDSVGARTTEDIYVGHTPSLGPKRVFGGQVLAQSVVAAARTVDEERPIHSLHGYFLRPGDPDTPITYGVERLRDGRSFSARRVHAYQGGEPILSMIASFELPGEGMNFQDEMPADVPAPESLPSAAEELGGIDHPMARMWAEHRPFDMRYPDGSLYLSSPAHPERNLVWMKTKEPFGDNPLEHQAALAYGSDFTLIETALRRAGTNWLTSGSSIASLDHAMWWHRPARVDEWLLFVQHATSAQGARALIKASVFNQAGELVATVLQEGMIRPPRQR